MKRILIMIATINLASALLACGGRTDDPSNGAYDEDDLGPITPEYGDALSSDDEVCWGPTGGQKAGALRKKLSASGTYSFTVRYANGATSRASMTLEPFERTAYCTPGSWGNGSLGPQPGRVTFATVAWIATEDGVIDGRFFVSATVIDGSVAGPPAFSARATLEDLRGTWKPALNNVGHPHHTLTIQSVAPADGPAPSSALETLAMGEINYMNSREYGYSQSGQGIADLRMVSAPVTPQSP